MSGADVEEERTGGCRRRLAGAGCGDGRGRGRRPAWLKRFPHAGEVRLAVRRSRRRRVHVHLAVGVRGTPAGECLGHWATVVTPSRHIESAQAKRVDFIVRTSINVRSIACRSLFRIPKFVKIRSIVRTLLILGGLAAMLATGVGVGAASSDVADAAMRGDVAAVRRLLRSAPTSTRRRSTAPRRFTGRSTATTSSWWTCCSGRAPASERGQPRGHDAAGDGGALRQPAIVDRSAEGRRRCQGARTATARRW